MTPPTDEARAPMRVRVSAKFEPRDLWVGVYWERHAPAQWVIEQHHLPDKRWIRFYVCIIPALPIIVQVGRW